LQINHLHREKSRQRRRIGEVGLAGIEHPSAVIPGRAEGANPESTMASDPDGSWIPGPPLRGVAQ
jgi:hypothetical protein